LSKKCVFGIILTMLLAWIPLSKCILYLSEVRPLVREESNETVKIAGSPGFNQVPSVPWENELANNAKKRNFACTDGNAAELVIGLRGNCYAEMENLVVQYGGKLADTISMGEKVSVIVSQVPFERMPRFMAEARAAGLLRYAESNIRFHSNFVPNDPYSDLQWALGKIDAYSSWNISLGSRNILVAVVDTGVDYSHPDLAANYVSLGYDWVNNDLDPMDDEGHGTHCAGIIAAALNNSIGIAGVAQVQIMAEKGLSRYGTGWSDDLASAICHAVDQGAKIVSCSWGSYEDSELIHDAVRYAYGKGALIVASAGNDALDLKNYPAAYEEVIAVTATDRSDERASFANYGDWVELSAPGSYIFSTMPDSAYAYNSGTSMSAPFAAGVAALVWSRFPNMTRDQVRQQLLRTSDDLGDSGFDIYFGCGRVNARKAVEEAPPSSDMLIVGWQKKPMTLYCELGESIAINVSLLNFGTSNQSDVMSNVLINGNIFDSETIDFFESGKSKVMSFEWTPHLEGLYNVTTYILPRADESNTDNNALTINARVTIPKVIQVEKNQRIQDAIDSAYPGDTVQVAAGTYYEHLSINKSLSLIGGRNGAAIIDGRGTGTVVHVLADKVNVTSFTLRNADRGICLDCSDGNIIANNLIFNNSEGFTLLYSGGNKITNNSMTDNECNFCVGGDFDMYIPSQFVQYMDTSNTVEGKPVYYWVNQRDKQVPNDAGYVAMIGSTNIIVRNLNLSKNGQGILIAYTNGSVIEKTNASLNKQGILLVESINNTVQDSVMINNDCAIDARYSFSITASKNTVINNTDGIRLWYSGDNVIQHNVVASNGQHGIWSMYSTNNEFHSNTVSDNFWGFCLAWSGDSIFRGNNVTRNVYNFGVDGNFLPDFILDIDTSNTVEGKLVHYLVNKHDLIINSSTFPNAGYVAVVNCTSITVRDLNMTSDFQGILLAYTNNSIIEKVSASNNQNGICLLNCNENTIRENVITSNNIGILLHRSTNNDIAHNTVVANEEGGIYLGSSSNNWIRNNTFSENRWGSGVTIEDSSRYNSFIENTVERNLIGIVMGVNEPHGNKIYYNNFIHNTNQVLDWTSFWTKKNTWDDDKHQGNYWSDYRGEDSDHDGIGDTLLPHLGIDNYPLMTKYWNECDINHDGKVDILDIAIVAKAFRSKIGDPNWNAENDLDTNGKIDIIDLTLVAIQYGKTT
jgi:thermitase